MLLPLLAVALLVWWLRLWKAMVLMEVMRLAGAQPLRLLLPHALPIAPPLTPALAVLRSPAQEPRLGPGLGALQQSSAPALTPPPAMSAMPVAEAAPGAPHCHSPVPLLHALPTARLGSDCLPFLPAPELE